MIDVLQLDAQQTELVFRLHQTANCVCICCVMFSFVNTHLSMCSNERLRYDLFVLWWMLNVHSLSQWTSQFTSDDNSIGKS